MKITQLRERREAAPAVSTLTLDAWMEKMCGESQGKEVALYRRNLQQVLSKRSGEVVCRLPRIVPAAEFRCTSGGTVMRRYNGLVELTVAPLADDYELEQAKHEAWQLPQTYCVFAGAGGRSVKIWVRCTRPDDTLPQTREEAEVFHAHAYRMVVKCYEPQLSFPLRPVMPELDGGSRFSFDPEVRHRPDSVPLRLEQPTEMPGEITYREAVQSRKSPFERVLAGISSPYDLILLFESALMQAYEEIKALHAAHPEMAGDRQALLECLSAGCLRSGIPEEEAVRRTFFRLHIEASAQPAVRLLFRNVYSREKGFGKQPCLKKEQLLALQTHEFMQRRYEFRRNLMLGEVEYHERSLYHYRFRPVDKQVLNSIALDAQMEGIPLWDKDVHRYVYSNRVPVYTPIEDYLFDLPAWDGRDRLAELAATVPCDHPHWSSLFRRWFLSMVAHWRGTLDKRYANHVSPLLVGGQGTRKSTFCRNLLPPELRTYYTDSIDFSRKRDAELALNRFALINIDEFDQISDTQQGFLKHILQKPVLNVRKPYGNAVLEMRRYASFIGTSNLTDLLVDPTGSRRFICVHVTAPIDTAYLINYPQLYAQALHLLRKGERYWFDAEEEAQMTAHNRRFERLSLDEQLFLKTFRAPQGDEPFEWMLAVEIMEAVYGRRMGNVTTRKISTFGRMLNKYKLPVKRSSRGYLYGIVQESSTTSNRHPLVKNPI